MADYVDSDDETIYRQLGGGVTASHSLHGSSNAVGGQAQLLKLRWGADPEALKFDGAPPTIKFALGENVKQAWNPEPTGRFPQSRMGVEQLIRDQFVSAREYRRAWEEWRRTRRGIPPRRDLGHDAIVEVLEGKRFIHCHAYRQDEILMLMRLCDEFGVKGVVFQHVTEGYKVADEMARRGDMASSVPDWWAYKFEVYDAIPHNTSLIDDVGVIASIGSDSGEMGRRLNQEAGKMMQYGGLGPERALDLVTINPAKQLRVEDRVGSIEVGKDADIAIWSGPPVSQGARCEQTWIEGRKYFDRAEDLASRAEMERMKEALLQKALRAGKK
jgi:N-acetylglucosamine-6-phosphate deacetylase